MFPSVAGPRKWVRWACARYRIPPPVTTGCRLNKGTSFYDPETHRILLRPRHWNTAIALHEAAHAITDYLLGHDLPAHGPQWLAVYMDLLSAAGVAPRAALEASARAKGLSWSRVKTPSQFRSRFRARIRRSKRERAAWT